MGPTRTHPTVAALLAVLAASLFGCEQGFAGPTDQTNPAAKDTIVAPLLHSGTILIDASRDGGVWWFPQSGNFSENQPHQGRLLADYLRSLGFGVDEIPRGTVLTSDLLQSYRWIIRAGKFGSYRRAELDAYDAFLSRGGTLVLLAEFLRSGQRDELAESIGLTLDGIITGTITSFEEHELTRGVSRLRYIAGSALVRSTENVRALAWTDDGDAVMGVVRHPSSKIFFLGDTNGIELLPQPLVDNLILWGFKGG